jgi:hypothetical protein
MERAETIRFSGVLVRTKAPLKRAQSRRFAHFFTIFYFETHSNHLHGR